MNGLFEIVIGRGIFTGDETLRSRMLPRFHPRYQPGVFS